MRNSHPVITSVAAAVLAAVVVFAIYLHYRAPAKAAHPTTAAATQSAPAKESFTPPAQPTVSVPAMPASLRKDMAPPKMPSNMPDSEDMREQLAMLRRFLELPPEKLARMRDSIERIERMTPERKAKLLERLPKPESEQAASEVDPENPLADAPEPLREKLGAMIDGMTPQARCELTDRIAGYTREQRAVFFEGMAAGASDAMTASHDAQVPWKINSGAEATLMDSQ